MESPSNAAPGALLKIWNYYWRERMSGLEREKERERQWQRQTEGLSPLLENLIFKKEIRNQEDKKGMRLSVFMLYIYVYFYTAARRYIM